MFRRSVSAVLRGIATIVMGVGVGLFVIGTLGSIMVLREGTTGLVGEGDRLQTESAEKIRGRLDTVGLLLAAVPLGWLLARLGDVYRKPEPKHPRITKLLAELSLIVGGFGLAMGFLARSGPWAIGYVPPSAYTNFGLVSLVVGLVFLVIGFLLFRRSKG